MGVELAPEFETVILDLINNGVESYIDENPKIYVGVSTLEHKILLKIKDFGSGISEDIQERVFDKGFSNGKSGGTGCGLYNAKSWITQAGGQILLESKNGIGTTIRLELPIAM